MASGYPDFEGQKSGVYLIPHWAAKEATDKNFGGVTVEAKSYGESTLVSYTVPPGKTLYITQFFYSNFAAEAADGDNNQMCFAQLQVAGTIQVFTGGNGGGSMAPPKPFRAEAGELVIGAIVNYANHDTKVGVGYGGYEL